VTAIAWLLLGCAERDFDEDGIPDDDEEELGLDPLDSDSDDDGLGDATELALGSDPLDTDTDDDGLDDRSEYDLGTALDDPDTDDDGYTDRDEVHENKDPLDPNSVIYLGRWPYYFEKTELKGGTVFEVGKRFANFETADQFGDVVSLWDFHNEDTYVLVDICAGWMPPCKDFGKWLMGAPNAFLEPWAPVRDAVNAGDLFWITVLGEGFDFEPTTYEDVVKWAEGFPNARVPVLQDEAGASFSYVAISSIPSMVLLEPNLKVHTEGVDNYIAALDAAVEILDR
jgi:hypothetical protein